MENVSQDDGHSGAPTFSKLEELKSRNDGTICLIRVNKPEIFLKLYLTDPNQEIKTLLSFI